MKFLLDEHLPMGLIAVIVGLGHEALHVKTLDMLSADDQDLWAFAGDADATIVSKDSAFLALANRDARPAGLLHLNLGNVSNHHLYEAVKTARPRLPDRLERGDVVVELRP